MASRPARASARADVDRRRPVARHRLLHRVRSVAPRGLRLVDVLAFGPDGYIRYGLDDPMAALASRTASFNEYLHNPPWAAEWIVHQAREHRIDGALVLRPRSMKPAATGRLFIERALEDGDSGAADRS